MVTVKINIERKHLFILAGVIVLLAGGLVVAYNLNTGDPPIMGHTANEIHIFESGGQTLQKLQLAINQIRSRIDTLEDGSSFSEVVCASGKYLTGINSNGNPICKKVCATIGGDGDKYFRSCSNGAESDSGSNQIDHVQWIVVYD